MPNLRCAIYTRKSSEEGLEQDFNSLDAQREACASFIQSQRHEGWTAIPGSYDDGGLSGGTMNRPALQRLLEDIEKGSVDVVVVYKVDRLTRSLSDFARIVEIFDKKGVSFVSVTQQFNTTSSMGRLTLNVLLSFAQFEREVTGERIRDKVAASRRKGIFMGGNIPLGYDLDNRKLVVNQTDAKFVRWIFGRYLELGNASLLKAELDRDDIKTKARISKTGREMGGTPYTRGMLYYILKNRAYIGEAVHKGKSYPGEHTAIVGQDVFDKVQALISANRQDHVTKSRTQDPSLLSGLVYDHYGRRLSPSHTNKNGLRYRYYVSGPAKSHGQDLRAIRVAAGDLEQLIINRLVVVLNSPQRLAEILNTDGLTEGHTLKACEALTGSPQEAADVLKRIVHKVIVGQEELTLQIDKTGLTVACGLGDVGRARGSKEQIYSMTFKANFRRIGSETKLIINDGQTGNEKPRRDPALIKALTRAHAWAKQLHAGKVRSLNEIAVADGLTRGYVSAIIRMAYLAPDITEAILEGRQPQTLMLKDMMRTIPPNWADQRRMFGFAAA